MLPDELEPLLEGSHLDVETLPPSLAGAFFCLTFGLYDEHGLKGKKKEEQSRSVANAPSEVQVPPTAAALPPFPFAGGANQLAQKKSTNGPNAAQPHSSSASQATSLPQQQLRRELVRTIVAILEEKTRRCIPFELSGMQAGGPLMPPNFPNPPPTRFPGGPTPFPSGASGFRGSRPGFPSR
uniref:Uncharacterized protein n=1 Tax=Parascaris equorum TaxID=6256 RepID=A0A914RBK9_PAREQ